MARLDDLPPDQRAALSLLLRSGKTYAQVAALLQIPERAVHDRAHAALAVLAPAKARALSAGEREQVGDYVLGQGAGMHERLAARTLLEGSPPAREWASALAAELQPLAAGPLPEIPASAALPTPARGLAGSEDGPADAPADATPATAEAAAAAAGDGAPSPPPPSGEPHRRALPAPPSSRRAGALLLAAIVAVVVVVVVLIVDSGGSSGKSGTTGTSAGTGTSSTGTGTSTSSTGTGTSGTSSTATAAAKEDRRITLTSPDPASKAVAVAEVLSEGNQYAFYLAAEHLPPSKGFFYAVWLYNSPSSFEALSRVPNVGSSGDVQGGSLLPKDASKYHTMLITRETQSQPKSPGPVVLRGAFGLH